MLDKYLHKLEAELQPQEDEEPCEAEEMEEFQPQETPVIETLETITLSLVTTKRTVNGVTSVGRAPRLYLDALQTRRN